MESQQEVTLEKYKFAVMTYVTEKLLDELAEMSNAEWKTAVEFTGQDFVLQVRAIIWGREVQRQEHRYPADWWEAVKERFAPEWFKRRWPVRYTMITLKARELYPLVSMPHKEHTIVVDKWVGKG
jgi:hypothetical protein